MDFRDLALAEVQQHCVCFLQLLLLCPGLPAQKYSASNVSLSPVTAESLHILEVCMPPTAPCQWGNVEATQI